MGQVRRNKIRFALFQKVKNAVSHHVRIAFIRIDHFPEIVLFFFCRIVLFQFLIVDRHDFLHV